MKIKYFTKSIFVLASLLFIFAGFCSASDNVVYTRSSVDFYGTMPDLAVGDTITAYDPSGILCGKFIVKKKGNYGFMHVYADDSTTTVDEGASPGDTISFQVNGMPVYPSGPDKAVWTKDGARIHVNFSR